MQTFTSDISKLEFPISEKIPGKAVRNGVLKEILKEHPDFNEACSLAVSELNHYKRAHIQNLLSKEVGTITELEQTVLDNINQNHLIASEISEIKYPVTNGQRWADRIAGFGGSWKFIGIFFLILFLWVFFNITTFHHKEFDPYPFILLNLVLSCIAAIQAPVIMMSQNRQEEKDRERARSDYMINLKSELEIRLLHEKLDHLIISQQENLFEMQQTQVDLMREIMDELELRDKVL